ncbi:unnamed protein product [Heligmosomoides polygyrus]|uniref:glucuronosyltransferase n=1 Tax=Heligmosomoides polygyrus TaxID=6339 RepID=A0A183G0R6_HELPZ|nr:unnamed protein product [Heligmosomoides polygyrus]
MIWLLTLCMLSPTALCLNVLVWNPTVAQSHVRFMGSIADILAGDGHNVDGPRGYRGCYVRSNSAGGVRRTSLPGKQKMRTIVSPLIDPLVDMVGHTSTAIHQIFYHSKYISDDDYPKMEIKGTSLWDMPAMEGRCVTMQDIEKFFSTMRKMCRALYSAYSDDMTFWQRLDNFKLELETRFRYHFWEQEIWSLANAASPGFPDLRELLKEGVFFFQKTGVVLLNVNEFVETPRPTANILRYIGGLTIQDTTGVDQVYARLSCWNLFIYLFAQNCALKQLLKHSGHDVAAEHVDNRAWRAGEVPNTSATVPGDAVDVPNTSTTVHGEK